MSPAVLEQSVIASDFVELMVISYLVFKHLRYNRFNHVVHVNRICVVMSCQEIDMGKFSKTVFSLTFHRDFQCLSRAHYDTNSTA